MKFFYLNLVTLLLLLNIFTSNSYCYEVEQLLSEKGTLNKYVTSIKPDKNGYYWLGTGSGLLRYSGFELKSYDLSNHIHIKNKSINEILNFGDSTYIIGKKGFILKYNYATDDFEKLYSDYTKFIISAQKLDDSKIILGTRKFVLIFDINTKELKQFKFDKFNYIKSIIVHNSKVYLGTANGLGVFTYSKKKNELTFDKCYLQKSDILCLNKDKAGRILFGTEFLGLFILDNDKLVNKTPFDLSEKRYAVRVIAFDNNGVPLVSVDRLGVYVLDEKFNVKDLIANDIDKESSIRQNNVHNIYVDSLNTYWFSVGAIGVDFVKTQKGPFKNIKHIRNEKNSIGNNIVRSFFLDKDGTTWYGTENGLYSESKEGVWKSYEHLKELRNTAILNINLYQDEIILCTYGQGVLNFDPKTERLTKRYFNKEQELKLVFTSYVVDDQLWIGGNSKNLQQFVDGKYAKSYTITKVRSIIRSNLVNHLFIGSKDGIFELNEKTNAYKRVIKKNDFNIREVQDLYLNHDTQRLWVAASTGFYFIDLTTNKVTQIKKNELSFSVFGVESSNEFLWLSTVEGLYRYTIKNGNLRKFNHEDGVKAKQFSFGASAKFYNGEIAFGGNEGAVVFNPNKIPKATVPSHLYLSDFRINGVPSTQLGINTTTINKRMVLSHNQNTLSFTFETPIFYGNKKNTYVWQLMGVDKSPVSSSNRSVTYSKLSPGKYHLNVKMYNPDGILVKDQIDLDIEIENPFYLSTIAILIYFFLFISLIVTAYLIWKAKEQERFSDEKIKFFINVAHDIRTPVSLIQLASDQIQKNINKENSLNLIRRNTKHLNDYVTQLLDFQKAERDQLGVIVQEIELKSFIEEMVLDFKPLLENKSIQLTISSQDIKVWFDMEKMIRVFNNLISNAIKYTNEGGTIKIVTDIEGDKVKISFVDNGIGIPEDQQKKIFSRFNRASNALVTNITGSGIGLLLSKKIIELHHGTIHLESTIDIGSKFTIQLPLGKNHFAENEIKPQVEEIVDNLPKLEINTHKVILLVEDNEDIRASVKAELEKEYKILEAPNGKEALVIALEHLPDMVITDVMMPKMSGKELCHILKNNHKTSHIPVIMLTALSAIEDKIEGLEIGADAYIEKPFRLEMLKVTVNNIMKSRHLIHNLIDSKKEEVAEKPKSTSAEQEFLSNVVEEIKKNVTNREFTIDVLCEHLGYSRSNLFRKLKKLSGMSPLDLIIKIRLNHAIELMKNRSDLRIADIAYESGFNDPKYFSTTFKKHQGKTPKEFIETLSV
ncbi:hybrid sensor histidine kinase/response regulator transcription factor [Flammeovirga kamogawensis]|uniref:histidine kinase n=1 Tax=Flammeovirga kamogawensis TaxID=373891 RepID=A0ABX8H1Y0_9BACT|nr:ATP-binding protein [Flammeovirga kamogawensis]MBB6462626.1 signal transduction histidine kinase/DNA-binding response OmpR family regulator/ligand-binding sensor domain-containing protein [Flammeovirga kamogawensis]QWG09629.1 response regulator [Flammeovirga kamogawensis]TRX65143.1 response regulator [Flammeovirga kamogawensis]